jgi:hypothetical protein
MGENGLELKEGLKTEEERLIKVTPRAKALLNDLSDSTDSLLFPFPRKGKHWNLTNYSKRFWIPLIESINAKYPRSKIEINVNY